MTEHELMKKYPCINLVCYYSHSNCLKVCFNDGKIQLFTSEQELIDYIEENDL